MSEFREVVVPDGQGGSRVLVVKEDKVREVRPLIVIGEGVAVSEMVRAIATASADLGECSIRQNTDGSLELLGWREMSVDEMSAVLAADAEAAKPTDEFEEWLEVKITEGVTWLGGFISKVNEKLEETAPKVEAPKLDEPSAKTTNPSATKDPVADVFEKFFAGSKKGETPDVLKDLFGDLFGSKGADSKDLFGDLFGSKGAGSKDIFGDLFADIFQPKGDKPGVARPADLFTDIFGEKDSRRSDRFEDIFNEFFGGSGPRAPRTSGKGFITNLDDFLAAVNGDKSEAKTETGPATPKPAGAKEQTTIDPEVVEAAVERIVENVDKAIDNLSKSIEKWLRF